MQKKQMQNIILNKIILMKNEIVKEEVNTDEYITWRAYLKGSLDELFTMADELEIFEKGKLESIKNS